MADVGVDVIFEVAGASRAARSYAFLYAAFKNSETSNSPLRDAIDCLTPFIASYLNQTNGQQLDPAKLQSFLQLNFDFDIPIYAIEQMLPSLQERGYLNYDKRRRIYIASNASSAFKVSREEIATDFESIGSSIAEYAQSVGFSLDPPSGSWEAALIDFLKGSSAQQPIKFTQFKGVVLDPRSVESSIVANFIRHSSIHNEQTYNIILKIFMGTLIEEFISTISEIGNPNKLNLTVFYDTSILLRLLGCSGGMLKIATEELTRYLQDLGVNIKFFAGNESEVSGILYAIVSTKKAGGEIRGETADAIANREIDFTQIFLMQNDFVERLAQKSIFPAGELETNTISLKQFQIDEISFARHLTSEALKSNRNYSDQNAQNDASYLASVMRLRKGQNSQDLSDSRYLFVTTNKILTKVTKRYLISQRLIQKYHCPPILNIGQVATIAWLLRERNIDPSKASRELLINCYAAVRPDGDWLQNFKEAISRAVGDFDQYTNDPSNQMQIQAARRIAQEETFGNPMLMKVLNTAEILAKADKVAEQEKENLRREAALIAEVKIKEQTKMVEIQTLEKIKASNIRRSKFYANKIRTFILVPLIFFVVISTILFDKSILFGGGSVFSTFIQAIIVIPILLSALDLVGLKVVSAQLDKFETKLETKITEFLDNHEP